jgi:hypothetical protein
MVLYQKMVVSSSVGAVNVPHNQMFICFSGSASGLLSSLLRSPSTTFESHLFNKVVVIICVELASPEYESIDVVVRRDAGDEFEQGHVVVLRGSRCYILHVTIWIDV